MELSICTDSVFGNSETVAAMRQVKALGINAIEFWSWWDKDIEAINQARQELNMKIVGICTKFISLTDSSERERYLTGLVENIKVAKQLGCSLIISQVGNHLNKSADLQKRSIVKGLRLAKELLEEADITLVIEPLNTKIDHPDYFLWSSDVARDIIFEVASPNVKLLFDFYHQQIMEGDLIRQSSLLIDEIGHFHLAGNPGRNEPESGEIDYQAVISQLDKLNYQGYIGFEYLPQKDVSETLKRWQAFFAKLK